MSTMDQLLTEADAALDAWKDAQRIADLAATKHKHITAATAAALSESVGKTIAKDAAVADPEWLSRQSACDKFHVEAQAARMAFEQKIRRWETARSEFSATRRVQ